ncbi:MAG TPA: integrase core domain-containing protein, partial [Polyangiaceae bacterium]|nr:integrase core domain-containing protein [Polyangiaceae bacterium]
AKYDGTKKRGPGRPRTRTDIGTLVIRMARENPSCGYTRIRGVLFNLGHDLACNTIKAILRERGIEPVPERRRHASWHTFVESHLGAIAGADFFTAEVLRGFGLVRYYVFFVIDIATRRAHIAGITDQPSEAWMKQIARNLTDCVDGFLKQTRYLILDRDPLYTKAFRTMLKGAGVKIVRLPARSPNLNPHAQRWVHSARSECLSRIILFGEKHLRRTIASHVDHYHMERNHQGLGNRLIEASAANTTAGQGRIRRRERLGGLLNYYYRAAA